MISRDTKTHRGTGLHSSRFVFWTINLMHDNPFMSILRNPYKLLKAAGLQKNQEVLEVGCGPGFFTIPAAKIAGENGMVYAIDVNPWAIKKVEKKIAKEKLLNAKAILANATESGLAEGSIDLTFVFGIRYVAGGLDNVLSDLNRVIKSEGILSLEKTTGSDKQLIDEVEKRGFSFIQRKGRIFLFTKNGKP
jgi:ubiquinone/menaquinone biosynthesis C-methylase UbiE